MPYSSEQMRSLLFRWLASSKKKNRNFQPEWSKCISALSHLVSPEGEFPGEPFTDADAQRMVYVLWDLIFDRILIPGSQMVDGLHSGWPFFTVTEHGWKAIHEARPIPYDPDGYLASLKSSAPGLHDTAFRYVEEAVSTFRARCYLASAVMLGAASERIFLDLAESIINAIVEPAKQKSFREKATKGKMRERVNVVTGWCRNNRAQLKGTWAQEEQVETIDRLADLIRRRRNDAGHPQDPPAVPTHEQTYASLVVFPDYCKAIYELKSDLDGRPASF